MIAPLYGLAASYTPLVGDAFYANGGEVQNVGSFIQAILTWSIGLASIAAVAMIIVNGFKYVAGAGNTNETNKARAGIQNAVIGLILLIASVFILNFINPTLTRLDSLLTPVCVQQIETTTTENVCLYERTVSSDFGDGSASYNQELSKIRRGCYPSQDTCENQANELRKGDTRGTGYRIVFNCVPEPIVERQDAELPDACR